MHGEESQKTADDPYSEEQYFTVCGLNTLIRLFPCVPFAPVY